jgi:hypothetical protein
MKKYFFAITVIMIGAVIFTACSSRKANTSQTAFGNETAKELNLVMAGTTLAEYTRGKDDEVFISVSVADDSFLKNYKTYDSFIEHEDYAHRIAFISNVPVKDFSWLAVIISSDQDEIVYEIIEELYRLDELLPQKPLVVSWVEAGIMSVFGFSYCDNDGQKKYFIGRVGNYGGDPEEYDGPAYLIYQLFP